MSKSDPELQLLVLRCQRRDREAFQRLTQEWSDRLLVYVRHYVENEEDAWDILQMTWVRILRGIQRLRDARRFPAWAYRIARNTALNHRRAAQYHHMESLTRLDEPRDETSDPLEAFEHAEAVYSAMQRLSLAHQEVLTLFFLHDLSIQDIGTVLGIPPGTVKSRLYHAKRALRQAMISGEPSYE